MTTFILWACMSLAGEPGKCRYEPMEVFATIAACKDKEISPGYVKKETKCLPDNIRLHGNGTVK